MFQHQIVIIPEINTPEEISDHTLQTAKVLSSQNQVYIYYQNIPPKNIFNFIKGGQVFAIKFLPFNRFKLIFQLNSYLTFNFLYIYSLVKHKKIPIYWVFYPPLANLIKFSLPPAKMIFDILDGFISTTTENQYFLKHSTIVSVMTKTLLNYYRSNYGDANYLLTHPASYLAIPATIVNPKIIKLSKLKNIVGYIGAINQRLDFNLIFDCLKTFPQANFVFAGPLNHDSNVAPKPVNKLFQKLLKYKNFHYLGLLPKNQIPHFLKIIQAGIIPYDTAEIFNQLSFPLKAIEYSIAQKPFISTNIPELNKLNKNISNYTWEHKIKLITQAIEPTTPTVAQSVASVDKTHRN
ncbi:hypothetical protein KBC75_02270 [Candidatus Shapirobacteria bacterium]|nr:hypothetical protein [Candidatus Shapirobacteria bacterium]